MSGYYEKEEVTRRERRDSNRDVPMGGEAESYVRESMTLLPPAPDPRPWSVPPHGAAVVPRGRSASGTWSIASSESASRSRDRHRGRGHSRSRSRTRGRTPLDRARDAVEDNFTSSTAGIGAGILGAVVGGFVANRASGALQQRGQKGDHRRYSNESNVPRLASTILGAVAGGLGANALTNHFEDSRERGRERQYAWERRYGREEDLPHYDSGRPADMDHRNGRRVTYDRDEEDYDFVYDEDRKHDRRR